MTCSKYWSWQCARTHLPPYFVYSMVCSEHLNRFPWQIWTSVRCTFIVSRTECKCSLICAVDRAVHAVHAVHFIYSLVFKHFIKELFVLMLFPCLFSSCSHNFPFLLACILLPRHSDTMAMGLPLIRYYHKLIREIKSTLSFLFFCHGIVSYNLQSLVNLRN